MAPRGKKDQRSGLNERVARKLSSQLSEDEREQRWREFEVAMTLEGKLKQAREVVTAINQIAENIYKENDYNYRKKEFHPNSELSYAENMLAKVGSAEDSLLVAEINRDDFMVTAFLSAWNLAEAHFDWWEEFVLGDVVAPTLLQRQGRSDGGQMRAKAILAEREPEWTRWQTEADMVWRVSPRLTKTSVAEAVVKRLSLAEKPDTVKRRIKKTGNS